MQRRRMRRRRRHSRLPLLILGAALTALIITIAARSLYTPADPPQPATTAKPTAARVSAAGATTPAPIHEPTPQPETPTVDSSAAEKPQEREAEPEPEWEPDEAEVAYIAKTIYGEAGVVRSKARRAAVGWCILNRVDSPIFPDTVEAVVTAPSQFHGYSADSEPPESYYELARDILTRYHREQQGEADVGRTLPKGYCFFWGDSRENHFTTEWRGKDYWDWTLPNPYED